MRFRKSGGLTESEEILARLCERSFLTLWTYPNLHKEVGKELVDLLIVFRNDVLLFSDKSCAYPDTGNPQLDWRRWFSRAIAKSAHQVRQAERHLRTQPGRVFLDARAEERLPIELPPVAEMRIHRICVATGASERCIRQTGQPMLALDLTIVDAAKPLHIGAVTEAGGFIHVFCAHALEMVLSELDTIKDVVDYFNAKAELVAKGQFKGARAEADLLAIYLNNNRMFPEQSVDFVLQPDLWAQVEAQAPFREGRRLNRTHRLWDGLIEHVTDLYLAEELEFGNDLRMGDYEQVVRIMAEESRFQRRILSQAITERLVRAREADGWIGSILPAARPDTIYVTLIGPGARRETYDAYRQDRSRKLFLRCLAAKAARPEARHVVGIGLDAPGEQGSSEDLIYLNTTDWEVAEMDRANTVRADLGYFVEGQMIERQHDIEEYPGGNSVYPVEPE